MATTSAWRKRSRESTEEFLALRPDDSVDTDTLVDIRASVKRFEEQYSLPSERLHEALAAGELIETLEVCDWLIQYSLLLDVEAW